MAKITKWRHGLQKGNSPLAKIDYKTLDNFKYSEDLEQLEGDVPLQTTLSSLFLDKSIKISGSGSDIAVTNLVTNSSAYPASTVLRDHRDLSNRGDSGVIRATASYFGDVIDDGSGGLEPRGGPAAHGSVPFVLDTVLNTSISIFEIDVIIEEPLSREDRLHYAIYLGTSSEGVRIYDDILEGVDLEIGDTFNWSFPEHSNLTAGMQLHVEMLLDKGNKGDRTRWTPLKVRPSEAEPDKIYARLLAREYGFKYLAYLEELLCAEYSLASLTDKNTLHFEDCSLFIDVDEEPILFETTTQYEKHIVEFNNLKARVTALENP